MRRVIVAPAAILVVVLAAATVPAAGPSKPSEATLEAYRVKCQSCHMADGNSPLEPLNFVDSVWKHGGTVKQIAKVIGEGVPGSAMLPFKGQLTDAEILALARYVRSFDKKPEKPAKAASKGGK